jgi:uncharacterized BrkB/YihY/UPF0761 family membrane protein
MDDTPAPVAVSRQAAWRLACAAAALGTLYASVSAYWALGGTALLDTIGGTLEREGRAGTTGLLVVVWVSVALKLAASATGLAAVAQPQRTNRCHRRVLRRTAWLIATLLVLYGGVLTSVGMLVQTGILHTSHNADHRALRWHAFLWDPWFLIWGLLLAAAMRDRGIEGHHGRRHGFLLGCSGRQAPAESAAAGERQLLALEPDSPIKRGTGRP